MTNAADSIASTVAQDRKIWTAFHFRPGNLDLHMAYEDRRRDGLKDTGQPKRGWRMSAWLALRRSRDRKIPIQVTLETNAVAAQTQRRSSAISGPMTTGSERPLQLAGVADFRLGVLDVRPSTREVVGPGGTDILEPRVMQVLVVLAARRGAVAPRSELIDRCWGGRTVGDDAINRCIQLIRRLAATHGGFLITTVPRVGYRLDAAEATASAPSASVTTAPVTTAPGGVTERRRITVLSCALVRVSGPAVDPEDWYEATQAWRLVASAAAEAMGGHVAPGGGDRLTAYFGYPQAREDAAERAVRAALAITETATPLSAPSTRGPGTHLATRGGVHTGLVVIAGAAGVESEVFGEAPHIAARAQEAAAPGAVAITATVYELVSDVITTAPPGTLGLGTLAGPNGPLQLHRAISATAGRRQVAPRTRSLFVGRDDELRLLAERWERTRDGAGQVVLMVGEAGIGKTRLVEEFVDGMAAQAGNVLRFGGAPQFASSPFHVAIEILRRSLAWRERNTPGERFTALEAALAQTDLKSDEAAPLVAELLNLPVPSTYPALLLAPDQRRKRLLSSLTAWVFAAARDQPLLLVIEDLHWVDPSSLELLQRLAEQAGASRLMLLCTARPEFRGHWTDRSDQTRLPLQGLAKRPMRRLVAGLMSRAGLSAAVIETVVARADGVPLFAEALARLIVEGDGARPPGPMTSDPIPATLLDSLAARLDRLSAGKPVAQLASVLGRQFSHALLRAVSSLSDEDLAGALDELIDAEVVHAHGAGPEATYRFRHALLQDAAHAALPLRLRRDLHASVAETIVTRFSELAEARPEVLARHWSEAGETTRAIAAWTRAAESAEARHAFLEAQEGYRRAIALLADQTEDASRDQRELDLGLAMVHVTMMTEGPQSAETTALRARNHALAERGGFLGANTGMRTMAFVQHMLAADWTQAAADAEQMRLFAATVGPDTERKWFRFANAMGHFTLLYSDLYRGELRNAEAQFLLWESFHDGGDFDQRMTSSSALGAGAQLAAAMGRPALARARCEKGRAWAAATGNPWEASFVEALAAVSHTMLRETRQAEAVAAAAVSICDEKGFQQPGGWARACLGWARGQRGDAETGEALIRKAILDLNALKTRVSTPFFLTLLGETLAIQGRTDESLATYAEALALNPDERLYRPYTLVARGELREAVDHVAPAQADFRDAFTLARGMGATGCEARAAAGLARLAALVG